MAVTLMAATLPAASGEVQAQMPSASPDAPVTPGETPPEDEALEAQARRLIADGRGADAARVAAEALAAAESARAGDTPPDAARRIARALRTAAAAEVQAGRIDAGVAYARRGLALLAQADLATSVDAARSLSALGRALYRAGKLGEALQAEQRAAELLQPHADSAPLDLAWAHLGIGESLLAVGDLEPAARHTAQALALFRHHRPPGDKDLARAVHNLARIQRDRHEVADARQLFDEALALTEAASGPDHTNVAAVLNNDGLHRLYVGDFEGARQQFERSVAIRRQRHPPGHPEIATGLNNLALLYWSVGNAQAALPLYEDVVAIDRATLGAGHPFVATALHNTGGALAALGRFDEAMRAFEESRAIRVQVFGPRHPAVAQSDFQVALALRAQGRLQEAEARCREVLSMLAGQQPPTHPQLATARVLLALLLVDTGRAAEALGLARATLAAAAADSGGLVLRWMTPYALSRAHAALGEPQAAIFWGKQAAAEVLAMRDGVARFDRSTQRSLIDRRRPAFTHLIELLLADGRVAEAQEVYRELKAEEFLDFTLRDARDARSPGAGRVPMSGATEHAADTELAALRTRLRAVTGELAVLSRRARLGLTEDERSRQQALGADAARLTVEIDAFALQIRERFARAEATTARTPVAADEARDRPPAGSARLQYVVTERRVLIVLVTATGRQVVDVPTGATALARRVDAFRQAIQARADVASQARALHDLLIAPVAARLVLDTVRRIELSLDGSLRYLPFAALNDGRSYLVERFALAVRAEAASAITAPAPQRTDVPARRAALQAFGLTRSLPGFAALPAVRREIDGIRSHVRGPVSIRLDDEFTRTAFLDSGAAAAARIHVASHFQFRPGTEINSFLLAGDGSRINLREIRLAARDLREVDVITLSACDTATGGGFDEAGREVEGLANVLLAKGAGRIVATLWPVADDATADLLPVVYRQAAAMPTPDYAATLRTGQLALLRQRGSAQAHPFFWAGFIVLQR
jgi:CHAT domain-containing protein/Tfp pilus assembly protein PilF